MKTITLEQAQACRTYWQKQRDSYLKVWWDGFIAAMISNEGETSAGGIPDEWFAPQLLEDA